MKIPGRQSSAKVMSSILKSKGLGRKVVGRAQPTKNMYGLAAAVWTKDINKAHACDESVSAQAPSGSIDTTCSTQTAHLRRGFKQSGIGRELGELRSG